MRYTTPKSPELTSSVLSKAEVKESLVDMQYTTPKSPELTSSVLSKAEAVGGLPGSHCPLLHLKGNLNGF